MKRSAIYVSDTGQPVDGRSGVRVLDNTTPRIEFNLQRLGIPETTVKLGVQTPVEIAFIVLTVLHSLKDVDINSLHGERKKPAVIGFNCAPRSGEAKKDSEGEPLIYFEIDGHEFLGFGKEVAMYVFTFLGKKDAKILEVREYGDIKDTSKGTQFRSLNYLTPMMADLVNDEALARAEILKNKKWETVPTARIPDFAFFGAEEFFNNYLILWRPKWDRIKAGQKFKLILVNTVFEVTKIESITDIDEGEIGLWESSSVVGDDYVALDLAYKRDVSKNDDNKDKALALTKLLNKCFKPGSSLANFLLPLPNGEEE